MGGERGGGVVQKESPGEQMSKMSYDSTVNLRANGRLNAKPCAAAAVGARLGSGLRTEKFNNPTNGAPGQHLLCLPDRDRG